MNFTYESMTKWRVGDYTVRVWKDEPEPVFGPSGHISGILENLNQFPSVAWSQIKQALEAIPEVNAYEILEGGDGIVAYRDWP